jgi:hypothetical protein
LYLLPVNRREPLSVDLVKRVFLKGWANSKVIGDGEGFGERWGRSQSLSKIIFIVAHLLDEISAIHLADSNAS